MKPLHLQSKTVIGMLMLLGIATALSLAGKLTPEMVDVIKFVGGGFFTTRAVSNYAELKK